MITVQGLSKKFGNNLVLDNISFSIHQGEVVGFLGPNAAGKTTTMRIITGLLAPTSGSVKVGEFDVADDSLAVRKKIGYLAENCPLYEEMKVFEFLKFIAEIRGVAKEEVKEKIKEMVRTCGLKKVINQPISELSKGYRQRVGLAQAMIHNPEILILDEPTSGLDPNQIVEIRQLIKKLGRDKTVILSTHILSEVQATCSRIIIINEGKIVGQGTSEELSQKEAIAEKIYVKIKGPKDEIAGKLRGMENVRRVDVKDKEADDIYGYEIEAEESVDLREYLSLTVMNNNWSILEFRREAASLEEVFRKLTKGE